MAYAAGYVAFQALTAQELNDDFAFVAPLLARKPSNETVNNSSAFQDDNHLFLPVEANAVYQCHLHLQYNSGATPDLKYQFTVPVGASLEGWSLLGYNTAVSLVYSNGGEASSLGGNGSALNADAWGILETDVTAGTMQLQWAQNTANASNTVMQAGAFLKLVRVA